MSIAIAKWTIEQYHELVNAGALADRQVELLAGNIIEMSPKGMSHAVYCSDAVDYLKQLLGDQAKVRTSELSLSLKFKKLQRKGILISFK